MPPANPSRRRTLRLINPRAPLSAIAMPGIVRRLTFSRKALFMPLNLAICAAGPAEEALTHADIVCRGDAEATNST